MTLVKSYADHTYITEEFLWLSNSEADFACGFFLCKGNSGQFVGKYNDLDSTF
ncbi:hypothetical protein Ddye_007717 [Dipteronia dyeriana]|uniref:Uncharacterized protein n=1 Tax=Dipteronia dyeriana TaxID=168575 RepID=A0AAD9XKH6_9ROSI|nr:hypothetical protein Ddye_007717 [Dipteronia dyeriana]